MIVFLLIENPGETSEKKKLVLQPQYLTDRNNNIVQCIS